MRPYWCSPYSCLQIGDKLAECLAFFGHHVGQQERVQQAVALGQVALEADAARFLAAHHDFALQHVVADELEADAVFEQFAAVLFANAVEHFGGVEGAGDGAGPAFAAQNPAQQHGEDLVRIDEVAVFIRGADAVGIAIGAQAGVAAVGNHRILKGADVRLDGLGVDAREQRIDMAPNLDVIDSKPRKDIGKNGAARAVHGIDSELQT